MFSSFLLVSHFLGIENWQVDDEKKFNEIHSLTNSSHDHTNNVFLPIIFAKIEHNFCIIQIGIVNLIRDLEANLLNYGLKAIVTTSFSYKPG